MESKKGRSAFRITVIMTTPENAASLIEAAVRSVTTESAREASADRNIQDFLKRAKMLDVLLPAGTNVTMGNGPHDLVQIESKLAPTAFPVLFCDDRRDTGFYLGFTDQMKGYIVTHNQRAATLDQLKDRSVTHAIGGSTKMSVYIAHLGSECVEGMIAFCGTLLKFSLEALDPLINEAFANTRFPAPVEETTKKDAVPAVLAPPPPPEPVRRY